MSTHQSKIFLKKVKVHNLKSVDLTLKTGQLVVFTGVSGSGKSSMAFDTLYMEGQRRYVESLSTLARKQLGEMKKPELEEASGISPTISIEQKTAGRNPRSTVGTMTEIYDYLRVLYARIGIPHCPISGEAVTPQSKERIIKTIQSLPKDTKIILLAPYAKSKKAEFKEDFQELLRKGFTRVRVDGNILNLEEEIAIDGNVSHDVDVVIDRLQINPENNSRIADSITQALQFGNGTLVAQNVETKEDTLFSMHAFSEASGLSYQSLEPQDFSFNSPAGMCPHCSGLGITQEFNLDKVIDPERSIAEDCCIVASSYNTVRFGNIYRNLASLYDFSVKTPWKKLSLEARKIFLFGTTKKWTKMHFVHPETGATWTDHIQWKGVLHEARTRFNEAKSESYRKKMLQYMSEQICPECNGSRLKPYPSCTTLAGQKIFELTALTIEDAQHFFSNLTLIDKELIIAEELLKEIKTRLQFLLEVGLNYLTLNRTAPTLSGGEAQRVRLASQIGSGLVGITYILDEPSIGLHPRDNTKLIKTLKHLKSLGNTVVVVEHDEDTIWEADEVIDFGPGPGSRGGKIVVQGSVKDLIESKDSITGDYISGRKAIDIPKKRRKKGPNALVIKGATHHNLKDIDVTIPLGLFVAVTGVSGSGKSSLVTDILHPALSNTLHKGEHTVGTHKSILGIDLIDKVIAIDQSPIGRNPRSNPSTYIKLFDEIRDLFAKLPESQAKGFLPGQFSFNVKTGSCLHCGGMGMISIDMDFMEDAWIECPVCENKRFDPETLSITFKGKNIYDVLEMEVVEALEFFSAIPPIRQKLETLQKVGMEYIKLGQSSTTLSGGEAQRVKLAKELVRPATGKTLYIFDEPTTGLHFHDVKNLLKVLHELVDRGNTVLVIEHNMDVVKTADWVIDIGPEGGKNGGEVVGTGTPETIAKKNTPSGNAIKHSLTYNPKERLAQWTAPSAKDSEEVKSIVITGAEQNNLKRIDVEIPRKMITICTGPSGSGKSSFAFDTVYAEGQRRYIESLSPYARQFVKQMPKPKAESVEGLSPAIAIEQKAHAGNPRSTIGTLTEIYDYLRILFARVGIAHCPETNEPIRQISQEYVFDRLIENSANEKVQILAPIELKRSERFEDVINRLKKLGFVRVRFNGTPFELEDEALIVAYDKKKKNILELVVDRLKVESPSYSRLREAIQQAAYLGNQQMVISKTSGDHFYNLSFAVESTGQSFPMITPHTFSFNSPEGMCGDCLGLGVQYGANFQQHAELSLLNAIDLFAYFIPAHQYFPEELFLAFLKQMKIDHRLPIAQLPSDKIQLLMNGSPEDKFITVRDFPPFRFVGFGKVLGKAGKSARGDIKEKALPLLEESDCPSCKGSRLNPLARHVTIDDENIADFCRTPLKDLHATMEGLSLSQQDKTLEEVRAQILSRLKFLIEVGLSYMTLDRKAPTLSGGEAQRIRLSRQLGSGLTGVLYVLDEPTIGLHPKDNERLNLALHSLKELGNTLLMVEHDPLTVSKGDYILDFGPKAGKEGGFITARGTFDELKANENSLTGAYLSGRLKVPIPQKRRKGEIGLRIEKASLHNLKKVSVDIPEKVMTCFTGVSGSGKSTLVMEIIRPAIQKGLFESDTVDLGCGKVSGISAYERLIVIDQAPIGHTVRSDVGTYVDLLPRLREFFAALPKARLQGLQGKHFSTNHRSGMCSGCYGLGYKKVEIHFLPTVKVTCEDCTGLRLNPQSLAVLYEGKNFGHYLETTVSEARHVFQNFPRIVRILDTLIAVGLGYLTLGQEVASLSGGEAQRIKLSRELAKRSSGKTLYLLDEPTTGLHSDDICKLLVVLHKLVDKGNTMIIIEHNVDMIKNADFVVDLGPGAGNDGGKVVATGTPEELAKNKKSVTGPYLIT